MCLCTSRLKIGPTPDAKGRGCPIAKWGRIEMRIPGLKARKVTTRGEAQRSPGERPSVYPRPVRPGHRCLECAGLSGLGISAPPDPALQAGLSHRRPSALRPVPAIGVACAGRQSLRQWEKNISACGEKSSPSPWSSPRRRGNNIRCLAVHRRPSTPGDQGLRAAAGRPIQCERPNAIPSPGGEGQDEGELPAPKAVTSSSVSGVVAVHAAIPHFCPTLTLKPY
jgi:hypothetical protein